MAKYPTGTMVAFASRSDASGRMTPVLSVQQAKGHGDLTWTIGEVVRRPEWSMDPDFRTVRWTSGEGLPVDARVHIDNLIDATMLRPCTRCSAMIYSSSDFCTGCTAEISGMLVKPFGPESERARDRLAHAMQEHGMSMTESFLMARVVLNTLASWGWVLHRVEGGSNAERDQALDEMMQAVSGPRAPEWDILAPVKSEGGTYDQWATYDPVTGEPRMPQEEKAESAPDYVFEGLTFHLTCTANPEQYDVYDGEKQVGYVRLRHGELSLEEPLTAGKSATVWFDATGTYGEGCFHDGTTRLTQLRFLAKKLREWQHRGQ
jgi:hypothetical protein